VIRQGLRAGLVDELAISVAPVILGAGKALFDGFDMSIELEPLGVLQREWATVNEYRVRHEPAE
jgi:dihydrofolate reductase